MENAGKAREHPFDFLLWYERGQGQRDEEEKKGGKKNSENKEGATYIPRQNHRKLNTATRTRTAEGSSWAFLYMAVVILRFFS